MIPAHIAIRSAALVASTVALSLMVLAATPGLGHAYPFWPAAGVAVALVMADGPTLLPAVALGSLLVNLHLQSSEPLLALVLAAGATLQTLVAAALGRRVAGPVPALRSSREILAFLLLTGPLSCLIGAGVSVVASAGFGILLPAQLPEAGFTWWAGDVLGVVVMTPATLMLLPEMHEAWDGRRLKLLLPSLLLLLAVQIAYAQAAALSDQTTRAQLKAMAVDAGHGLTNNLDRHSEAIDSVRRLMLAADSVSAEQFRLFSRDVLARLPGLHGLSWNPVITAEQRPGFERSQGQDPSLPGFRISERNAQGRFVPAGRRARHVPVAYIEPLGSNRAAVGFDILSNPARADAIRRAERTGQLQATEPITLVQEKGTQRGVLVLDPLKTETGELSGFAVGVYRLGDLLRSSFTSVDARRMRGMVFELRLPGARGEEAVLARYGQAKETLDAWAVQVPFSFGGQSWELALLPSQAALLRFQSSLPQQLLLACLLLVVLNQAYLLLVTGRDQLERRQSRINHHLATHDPLTNLLNRRAFMAALEQARGEAESGLASHALFVIDLDHFKPINDCAGHAAGDIALARLAQCLLDHLRDDDQVARIGGDEFAVILRCCQAEAAQKVARQLLEAIETLELIFDRERFTLTASLGIRVLDHSAGPLPSGRDLMREADQACYAAKHRGRNQWALALPESSDDRSVHQ